jgi:hypothetical protein
MPVPQSRWIRAVLTAIAALALAVGVSVPALADPVPGTITGQLTDGGAPVSAQIQLVATDFSHFAFGSTDAEGRFTFSGLPAAAYRLTFNLPGAVTQYYPGKILFEDGEPITVTEGAVITIDETVAPHGSVRGNVTQADGSAAPGIEVRTSAFSNNPGASTTTNAAGDYVLPYVWPDTYRVSFGGFGSPGQWADQKTSFEDADPYTVAAGQDLVIDQQLLPAGAIAGVLTDANGAPVPFVTVQAEGADSSTIGHTGPDGSYRIVVRPGSYRVAFFLPGGIAQWAHGKTTRDAADLIEVGLGPDTIVNEQLLPTGTVRGRLVDAAGAGVPFASLHLEATTLAQGGFTSTDTNGEFSINALPGTYTLSFQTQHGVQFARGKTSIQAADRITVAAGETVVVDDTLAEPGTVVVTARDDATGAPLLSFCAIVAGVVNQVCTSDGTATITSLPTQGTVRVYPIEPDYLTSEPIPVVVTSGSATPVEARLRKGGTVTAVVTDSATGAPVEGACLELIEPLAPTVLGHGGSCSDATGTITVRAVRPAVYTAFVAIFDGVHGHQWVGWSRGTGAQATARLINVRSGGTSTLQIKLDQAGTIIGTVTDKADGRPIGSATVGLSSWDSGFGSGGPSADTNSRGQYTLGNLGPYDWTLFIGANGYASQFSGGGSNRFLAQGVRVQSGQTTTYDVNLTRGTKLTGTVTGPNGEPVDFVRIRVFHALSGDEFPASDVTGTNPYLVPMAGPTLIKVNYSGRADGVDYDGWVGGADWLHASVVLVPGSGTKNLNITMSQVVAG